MGECQPLRLEIARVVNVEVAEAESIPVRAGNLEVIDYITVEFATRKRSCAQTKAVAPIEVEDVRVGAAGERVAPRAAIERVVPLAASERVGLRAAVQPVVSLATV